MEKRNNKIFSESKDANLIQRGSRFAKSDGRVFVEPDDILRAIYFGYGTEDVLKITSGPLKDVLAPPVIPSRVTEDIFSLSKEISGEFESESLEAACLMFSSRARLFAEEYLGSEKFTARYAFFAQRYLGDISYQKLKSTFHL